MDVSLLEGGVAEANPGIGARKRSSFIKDIELARNLPVTLYLILKFCEHTALERRHARELGHVPSEIIATGSQSLADHDHVPQIACPGGLAPGRSENPPSTAWTGRR